MATTSLEACDDSYLRHDAMRPIIPYSPTLFSPPTIRLAANAKLDRSAFTKTINLAAAAVRDPRLLAQWRKKLDKNKELLTEAKVSGIQILPERDLPTVVDLLREAHQKEQDTIEDEGKKKDFVEPKPWSLKCLLLRPGVKADEQSTFGPTLKEGLESKVLLKVVPFDLHLDYLHWEWNDIVTSILPPELHVEIPHGYNSVGHVAHLNLREHHLPYRHLIGQILLDKGGSTIRTVINKTDEIGESSEFRTFTYEVLAGEDDLDVEVAKMGCLFKFNYGKTYWNSKLDGEHRRLVDMFKPGEVVVDVMAGIGPFSVPAARQRCLVWANDYNPDSVEYMRDAIKTNKVGYTLRPFNQDGRLFIPWTAKDVLRASKQEKEVTIPGKKPFRGSSKRPTPDTVIPIPPTISHFVMNLPASAPEFLGSFRGLYHGQEGLFAPHTEAKLPLLHVHCFATKQQYAATTLKDSDMPYKEILPRFSKQLGHEMKFGRKEGMRPDQFKDVKELEDDEMAVWDVREVSPKKSMYCVSFRLPADVAFA
ncbi:hypothetical protein MKZ38_007113 [Zalerion maritima]|uniref:tRNA (guanine(37)-N1)-methyltransferase n=1 Tax=Zalerion maritima TaxID=339359 RepID=A0AAD5WPZ3_9PEZI|nr:hypothetical protein MKZ38_007113 [Zalerion maritima]